MTFYKNIRSCIINNGITSNYFVIKQGVKVSPYLFVVAVEILAIIEIRQNLTIKGMTVDKKETVTPICRRHNSSSFRQKLGSNSFQAA